MKSRWFLPCAFSRTLLLGLVCQMAWAAEHERAAHLDDATLKAEAGALVQSFATSLQAELKEAIARDGMAAAIAVCRTRAPEIARSLSTDGWHVGRTSLRTRNADNEADAWEQAMLQQFDGARLAGESFETLVVTSRQATPEGDVFRFMKAIPVQSLCLGCHGTDLAPDVQAALASNYPLDMATGYLEGEVRGAFTLTKRLQK